MGVKLQERSTSGPPSAPPIPPQLAHRHPAAPRLAPRPTPPPRTAPGGGAERPRSPQRAALAALGAGCGGRDEEPASAAPPAP